MRASPAFAAVILLVLGACAQQKTTPLPEVTDVGVTPINDAGTEIDAGEAPDAGVVVDAGEPEDAGTTPDAGETVDAGTKPDAGTPDAGPMCPPPPSFDYHCDAAHPTTCPDGFCIGSLCIAPQVNQDRWDDCGNGQCDPCETATSCPVDCATPPTVTGTKDYNNNTTITVWVHGFANKGADLENMTYGDLNGCSDLGTAAQNFGENRPCGDVPGNETKPNQIVGVEYYGAKPPTWMTPQDLLEVESYPYSGGPLGLQRYGLIVAKFIKWRMALSGATHVNIACHSMGCLISRYMIENDIEHLASENKIVRWVTSAGVVAGARLARLYDNPTVRQYAGTLGFETSDFIIMNPDYVRDVAAAWDHQLYEGNSPLFKDILIHHGGATDPRIADALNFRLLDASNPDDEPNDGIMFTFDEFFHKQRPEASHTTPSGEVLSATHSYTYVWHSALPDTDSFGATSVAAAFHRRKVFITLSSFNLKKDREFVLPWNGEAGLAPDDIVVETEVRYDPYTVPAFGRQALVHNDKIEYRSPDLFSAEVGTPLTPKITIFEGPVFDAQTSLRLKATIVEADIYPRFKLAEDLSGDVADDLVGIDQEVTLQDQVLHIENDWAAADIDVHVVDQY